MKVPNSNAVRLSAIAALFAMSTASTLNATAAAVPGMSFNLKIVLKHTPTSGPARRAVTLSGHGLFGGGMGRVEIDTVDAPAAFRKGDFIIIRDTMSSFWARPSDHRVRRMNAPLVNPLEGISERLTAGTGTPSVLKVVFDTVSLDEVVNGVPTRHFRITADAIYPVGSRNVTQKVTIEQWLAKIPVHIVNPFGSRIRGLPGASATRGQYRTFINTLAAANRVFGEAVTVRTLTTTSYVYGPGLGEDYYQTVDLTDLKQTEVDQKLFELGAEYKMTAVADSAKKPVVSTKKPPVQ